MAASGKAPSHKWSPQEVRTLITFRTTNHAKFLRCKSASESLWEQLVKELGLEGRVTPQQASKKWENLKKRYKDLKSPKTGSGTGGGEVTAASWQFYGDMHEVLGSRPSMDPVVVVASFSEDPTTMAPYHISYNHICQVMQNEA
ncbi:unnamed protein product [Boreogadus saida]